MKKIVTISVVAYKTDEVELSRLFNSFLIHEQAYQLSIFLVDNSPTDELNIFENVIYIPNPSNPGFGAAHNIAISKAIQMGSKYHFVVNPDIYFKEDVLGEMLRMIEKDATIGMVMPKILNPDGSPQYLPKLLPSPWHIVRRKIKWPYQAFQRFINWYELRDVDPNITLNVPVLSGCFTLLNLEAIKNVGSYDDTFFMYFEDWDLSRRIHQKYKTLYFSEVAVFHGYHSGANHNMKLLKIFLRSAYHYFTKWGWFIDKERKAVNRKVLEQIVG